MRTDGVHVVTRGFKEAEKVSGDFPHYTPQMRTQHVEGWASIKLCVDTTGSVFEANVLKADHPTLGQAAQEAVMGWRFRPAELRGERIASCRVMRFSFNIR